MFYMLMKLMKIYETHENPWENQTPKYKIEYLKIHD